MRILAYTDVYAHKTVTFIINELKYLDANHNLHLLYSTRINPDDYLLKSMKLIPYRFNRVQTKLRWWGEKLGLYYPHRNRVFAKLLNAEISLFKPDLIQCYFGTDYLKFAANLNEEHRNIPVVTSLFGFDVTEKLSNPIFFKSYVKYMRNKNVYPVAVSDSLTHQFNRSINPLNQTITLHSGIDTEFFKRKRDNQMPAEFTFIQVSSYLEKKGHCRMLRVFKKFIEEDKRFKYRLILAGYGSTEDQVRRCVIELNLDSVVTMLPPLSPEQMIDMLSQANVFIQMSETATNGDKEGLPNVLLEAMSLELPILSTLHAGIPDIVLNGVNGILCEEKNEDAYLMGFREIVTWGLCPQNRERIVKHFSLTAHMQKLEELYTKILNSGYTKVAD